MRDAGTVTRSHWWPRGRTIPALTYAMLGLAGAILITNGYLAYRHMSSTAEADRWENHTYVVMETITGLLFDLADMQGYERGFVMTGEKREREQYEKAADSAQQSLESLKSLTLDNRP